MKFISICLKCKDESLIVKESYRYNIGRVVVSQCHCGYEEIKPLRIQYNYREKGDDSSDYK